MSSDWQTFLSSIESNSDITAELTDNFIAPLSHYGLLMIEGPDTASFLQGQTTCDITTINDQQSVAGSYCTPKGRMITSFRAARTHSECYLLRMRRDVVDSSKAVFGKYIVFSKAEQTDASNDYIILGLYGKQAAARVSSAFDHRPDAKNAVVKQSGNLALQLDNDGLMFECWIQCSAIDSYWPLLSQAMNPAPHSHWELLTIRQGIAEITADTAEMFIPQMLNYQLTDHVSFNKGCYTGQEVVARMQYRGKLKRHMYRASVASAPATPGAELYSPATEQSIGNVVNSVSVDQNCSELLAVITHTALAQGDITVGKNGAKLSILSLPYAITNEDA